MRAWAFILALLSASPCLADQPIGLPDSANVSPGPILPVERTLKVEDVDPVDSLRARHPSARRKPAKPTDPSIPVPPYEKTLSIREDTERAQAYCRYNDTDPKCAEFNGEHKEKKGKRSLSERCKRDPLDPKCIERTQRNIDEVIKVERDCIMSPNSRGCRSARKRLVQDK